MICIWTRAPIAFEPEPVDEAFIEVVDVTTVYEAIDSVSTAPRAPIAKTGAGAPVEAVAYFEPDDPVEAGVGLIVITWCMQQQGIIREGRVQGGCYSLCRHLFMAITTIGIHQGPSLQDNLLEN